MFGPRMHLQGVADPAWVEISRRHLRTFRKFWPTPRWRISIGKPRPSDLVVDASGATSSADLCRLVLLYAVNPRLNRWVGAAWLDPVGPVALEDRGETCDFVLPSWFDARGIAPYSLHATVAAPLDASAGFAVMARSGDRRIVGPGRASAQAVAAAKGEP